MALARLHRASREFRRKVSTFAPNILAGPASPRWWRSRDAGEAAVQRTSAAPLNTLPSHSGGRDFSPGAAPALMAFGQQAFSHPRARMVEVVIYQEPASRPTSGVFRNRGKPARPESAAPDYADGAGGRRRMRAPSRSGYARRKVEEGAPHETFQDAGSLPTAAGPSLDVGAGLAAMNPRNAHAAAARFRSLRRLPAAWPWAECHHSCSRSAPRPGQ